MRFLVSLVIVSVLALAAAAAVQAPSLRLLFGVIFPYFAAVLFLGGFIFRVLKWARAPVPFRIPTTCGQQKSLPWIRSENLENPHNSWGVLGRIALEVFFFRSLFRNVKARLHDGPKLTYDSTKWLWIAALVFHYGFLVVIIRHSRFFLEPVPWIVLQIQRLDGFFQIGAPVLYATGVMLAAALAFLLVRRLWIPEVRYVSLLNDYFPLVLLLGIAGTGLLLRHVVKTDVGGVKEMVIGLLTLSPVVIEGLHWMFYVHLFFVSVLLAYFPFSKLMHAGGVFLSPTRNMANSNRAVRHVNPWDRQVRVHTYAEYEDEFRDKMTAAGIAVERE